MTTLVFGNTAPVHEGPEAGVETQTTVEFPEGANTVQMLTMLTAQDGVVNNHTTEAPTWVASDSDGLATLIAEHYGCPKKGWPLDETVEVSAESTSAQEATPEAPAVVSETPGV